MSKSAEELRALWRLSEEGRSYEEFPDGATWADLEDAKQLYEREHGDAGRND